VVVVSSKTALANQMMLRTIFIQNRLVKGQTFG
jgi:hypothetical protein